jgi:hypothetical protein
MSYQAAVRKARLDYSIALRNIYNDVNGTKKQGSRLGVPLSQFFMGPRKILDNINLMSKEFDRATPELDECAEWLDAAIKRAEDQLAALPA